jgi:transposase-like protein
MSTEQNNKIKNITETPASRGDKYSTSCCKESHKKTASRRKQRFVCALCAVPEAGIAYLV